jgi:replicative DNA helicase
MTKFNDNSVEKTILSYLLKDVSYIEETLSKIKVSTFCDENHKRLFDLISRYFEKYHKTLSYDILEKFLKRNEKEFPTDLQFTLLTLHGELSKTFVDDSGFRFYLDELKELEIKRELYNTAFDMVEDLANDRNISKSLSDITGKILNIKTFDSSNEVTRRLLLDEDPEIRWKEYLDKKEHPEKYKGIPYGMTELDQTTGGQFPSKLAMVFGRLKKGKSRFLFNVGCNDADLGYKVMYASLEMELAMLQLMWESRYTGISFNDLRDAKLTEEEEKIYRNTLDHLKERKCPFYVVDISRGMTPSMVGYEIELHKKVFGVKPDIILIDYANLMRPDEKFRDRSEKYDNVFRELKEIARAYKVSILTAAQQNRKSLDVRREEVDAEHVSFSDASAAHCDLVLNIWHGFNQAEAIATQHAKRVYLKIVASRYSESKTLELFADFGVNFIGDLDKLQEIWKKAKRDEQDF